MKINYHRKVLSKEERVRIATDYNSGMTAQEVAARYNIATSTVYKVLHEMVEEEEKQPFYEDKDVIITD